MDLYNKNILYAISNLGLGHAQRSLPIIRHLLSQNNRVSIVAFGAALILLKEELAQQVNFIELIGWILFFHLHFLDDTFQMTIY